MWKKPLLIKYRSQVLKWQHGDLKIPLWFYLAQALYFNGDQKPQNTALAYRTTFGSLLEEMPTQVSLSGWFYRMSKSPFYPKPKRNFTVRKAARKRCQKKKRYLIQLICRKLKAILLFFQPLMVSYVHTRKLDSKVNGKVVYTLEATIFFHSKE